MPKKKGLTILLDEDISSALLVDLLEWKGYKVELVTKGAKDHVIRRRLGKRRMPLFFTKDKGWLRAGAVPKHHGGVVVFHAGHLNEEELAGLVLGFIMALEGDKKLSDVLLDRRFLRTLETILEYARDGSRI